MEYLEDYECDRTEEIIRYTWNSARYNKDIRNGMGTLHHMMIFLSVILELCELLSFASIPY